MTKRRSIITKLQKALKKDKDFYYSYQANIAMAIKDEYYWYKKRHNKKYMNSSDLHEICNQGAKNFLNLLIK